MNLFMYDSPTSSSDLSFLELQALSDQAVACLNTPSYATFSDALSWLRDLAECDRIVLCQLNSRVKERLQYVINHSYCEKWLSLYENMGFHQLDPVLKWAEQGPGTFRWSEAYRLVQNSQEEQFLEVARDHGLVEGLAHSHIQHTGRHALTTICSLPTNNPKLHRKVLFALNCLVPIFHFGVSAFESPSPSPKGLTKREMEILQWAANGKTVWEISKLLTISEATVKFHLGNIYQKLDVVNRAQAISAAFSARLI